MGRSSRYTLLWLGLALAPTNASGQVYGFPSAVGVLDDGFGALPPPAPPPFLGGYGQPDPSSTAAPAPLPPPPCALIIEVGKGLRHRAATRVVYGHAAPCR